MRAVWYDHQGTARESLQVGELPDPEPGEGEVRMRVEASGVNPGDVKKRANTFRLGMAYPRVIPHSDGAGVIDRVGPSVGEGWLGQRVWCHGAQSYRPFGTAAQYAILPVNRVHPLPAGVDFEQGALLGIPALTAHRAVDVATGIEGKWVLVQGAAGAVGSCAVAFAKQAGARVIARVRSESQRQAASRAGADAVIVSERDATPEIAALAPEGVALIVEVALAENLPCSVQVLAQGGTLSAYASNEPEPRLPFWPLLFKNVALMLIGSDDLNDEARSRAEQAIHRALSRGWLGLPVAARFGLDECAQAHEAVESGAVGRVIVRPWGSANDSAAAG